MKTPFRAAVPAVLLLLGSLAAQDSVAQMAARLAALERASADHAGREKALLDRVADLERRAAATEASPRSGEDSARSDELSARIDEAVERLRTIEGRPALGSSVLLGGYFDIEFRSDHAEEHSTFSQHRLVLKLDAEVADRIAFRSEIEIEGGGAGSDFLTDDELSVEYAALEFHLDRALNFKAGALLVPFGRLNILHDAPLLELTDRPLMHEDLIPTTWSEAGVGAFGSFAPGGVILDYDVILCNGLTERFDAAPGGGFEPARASFREDNNDNKMVVGRVGLAADVAWIDALTAGFSFGYGKYDDEGRRPIRLFGADAGFREGPFELKGEYAFFSLDRGATQIADGVPGEARGWYVEGNWRFFPDCWRSGSDTAASESTFTLSARYDRIDTDTSARGIDRVSRGDAFLDDRQRVTFGLNFRPVQRTVIKIEYQWLPEVHGVEHADNDRIVLSLATYF